MCGVAAGQHFSIQQEGISRFPCGDFFTGDGVEIDPASSASGLTGDLRPVFQPGRLERGRAAAVQGEMHMPGGCAVGDDGDGLVGRVGREILYLYIQHGGETAQALCADAQLIDLLIQFEPQFLGAVTGAARL